MENEIWKDIPDYEGLYQVSNYGNVRRLKKWVGNQHINQYIDCAPKQINAYTDSKGYKRVCLTFHNRSKHIRVHRLVAQAFIDNPNNLPEVNHKDENKFNNNVNNLEWCTHRYNNLYGTRVQRIRESNILSGKHRKSVVQCDMDGNIIKVWDSVTQVSETLKICISHISNCCHNKRKSAGGFMWKFE